MRAAGDRDLIGCGYLVFVPRELNAIETVTDDIAFRCIDWFKNESVCLARRIQSGVTVPCRMDVAPDGLHSAAETSPVLPLTVMVLERQDTSPSSRSTIGMPEMIAPIAIMVSHSVLMIAAGATLFRASPYIT